MFLSRQHTGRPWIALALTATLVISHDALGQVSSMPSGATPSWSASAKSPARTASIQTAMLESTTTVYEDTSLTACPDGQSLSYFWYAQDSADHQASSWCGAAQADIDWANRTDPNRWRIPYLIEECVPGSFWTYSHALQNGTRFLSRPYRGINMVCTAEPPPADPPIPAEPPESPLSMGRGRSICPADGFSTGNPILPATREKLQTEVDYTDSGTHALNWVRTYRSNWVTGGGPGAVGLGTGWRHTYAVTLTMSADTQNQTARIVLGDGTTRLFTRAVGAADWQALNSADRLTTTSAGHSYGRADDDSRWQFDNTGKPLSHVLRNGWTLTFTYNAAGQLAGIANHFGRSITLTHDGAGMLQRVTLPDGRLIEYRFDTASRLSRVTHADGKFKDYVYENPAFPGLLTGVIDENGSRFASFSYDGQGGAIATEHAGGASRYSVSYGATRADPVTVTDPLGMARTYVYSTKFGKLAVESASQPSGTGAPDAASRAQSSVGLIDRETDFLGVRTLFTWDMDRRLPLTQTRAANRPEAQTTATQWHPTLRLPVRIDEPGRSTAYTYDSTGNPLTETVTDTATGEARTRRWSYNPQGLVASLTDERGGVWTYTYDAAGNRVSERNPLGQETRREFDAAARVTKETAPNGLVTTYAYDGRGRLLSLTTGGETSSYTYTPSGQIAGATLSGGLAIAYQYDAAQRLIGTSDNRGNRIAYTLDAMGNRVGEEVRDANGNLALSSTRVINSLNQVAASAGALGQTTRYTYDANGERIAATDPLNQSTAQSLDALRRPVATTFADNAQARQSWTALNDLASVTDPKGVLTTYTRNAFGEVTAETSPDSGTIRHQFDAAGNVTARTDALSQTTRHEYDAANRLTRTLQADGKEHLFSYDASQPNTPSSVVDPSGATTWQRDIQGRITAKTQSVNDNPTNPTTLRVAYTWNAGQLAQIGYPSGLNVYYRRSANGQITGIDVQEPGRNKPVTAFVTQLSHTALGQPKAWRWASGDAAQRSFDADGRMVSSEIASYQYDAAGRISAITQSLHASQTQTVVVTSTATGTQTGTATAVTTTYFTTPITWAASYDSRNRLSTFTRAGAASAYTWDANGNRLTSLETTRADTDLDGAFDAEDFSATTAQSLTIAEGSNRLLGFTQTLTNVRGTRALSTTSAQVAYSMDAAGNLTSDGLRSFNHDASGRLAQVRIGLGSEEAATVYLHNALGQRVFKSEPQATQYAPDEQELGEGFISWLKKNFGWLFAKAQANATLGQSYVYADAPLPEWALLGEYGNGGSKSTGRLEIVWLPTEDGNAIPVGLYRNGRLHAIHPDHLGTPRLITDEANLPVWQWPYSAFGANKPTGILKTTPKPKQAYTNEPMLLKATNPAISFNLRYPGQYFDEESNLNYNYFRSYSPGTGRYSQPDPIGLEGGLNRYLYAGANPFQYTDPYGLNPLVGAVNGGRIGALGGSALGPLGTVVGGLGGALAGAGIGWYATGPMWNETKGPNNAPPIPPTSGGSPGKGWEWKGTGSPESGRGNWVNPETGQKLHPDLNHPAPKGPHWGLTNPDGSKWDYFPDSGKWQQCR